MDNYRFRSVTWN